MINSPAVGHCRSQFVMFLGARGDVFFCVLSRHGHAWFFSLFDFAWSHPIQIFQILTPLRAQAMTKEDDSFCLKPAVC